MKKYIQFRNGNTKLLKIPIFQTILLFMILATLVLASTWTVDQTNFSTGTFNKTAFNESGDNTVGIILNDSAQEIRTNDDYYNTTGLMACLSMNNGNGTDSCGNFSFGTTIGTQTNVDGNLLNATSFSGSGCIQRSGNGTDLYKDIGSVMG